MAFERHPSLGTKNLIFLCCCGGSATLKVGLVKKVKTSSQGTFYCEQKKKSNFFCFPWISLYSELQYWIEQFHPILLLLRRRMRSELKETLQNFYISTTNKMKRKKTLKLKKKCNCMNHLLWQVEKTMNYSYRFLQNSLKV